MKTVYALRDYDNDEIVAVYLKLDHAEKIKVLNTIENENPECGYKIERTFLIEDEDMEELFNEF